MAYGYRRKTYGKPRPRVTKKAVRVAKKVVAKRTKSRAKKGMDTKFVSCKMRFLIVPKQDGTNSNHTYNNFALLSSNPSVDTVAVQNTLLYQQNAALYDKVRVNGIRVTCTPKANVLDQYVGQLDVAANMTGPGMFYSALDRDGPLPWGGAGENTVRLWEAYKSFRTKSVLKKHVRAYKCTYPQGLWLDTNRMRDNQYLAETTHQDLGLLGCIGIFTYNNVEDNFEVFNEPLYEATVEWNVVFMSEKPTLTTVDPETGITTITPLEYDYDDMYPEETWERPIQPIPPPV